MQTSEAIDQLAAALVQAEFPKILKDASNPHFHSRYASLGAIVDAVTPALTAVGIRVVQSGGRADDSGSEILTRLMHVSGQWIQTSVWMPYAKASTQGAGSAITYGRRYGLSAALGIVADDDDDGNAGEAKGAPQQPQAAPLPSQRPATPTPRATGDSESRPANTLSDPPCPSCGGKMWDNREGKKNPKAPDFKCRDKKCEGVIWPPKGPVVGGAGPGKPGADFSDFPAALEEPDDLPW